MSRQSKTKDVTTFLEEVPAYWKMTLTKLRKQYLALLKSLLSVAKVLQSEETAVGLLDAMDI